MFLTGPLCIGSLCIGSLCIGSLCIGCNAENLQVISHCVPQPISYRIGVKQLLAWPVVYYEGECGMLFVTMVMWSPRAKI